MNTVVITVAVAIIGCIISILTYFAGQKKTFSYCINQYGAPLLGKAASKLDAHRINIECFLKYSQTATEKEELKDYYSILRL